VAAPGVTVAVATDAELMAETVRRWAQDQIPFAAAVALTRLSQDVRAAEIADLPSRLRVHGKRLAQGFRVRRAEKRDWPHITSEVGSLDEFMVLQEYGGTKRPTQGAQHLAIPARYVEARRSATTGRFARRLLPRGDPRQRKIPGRQIRQKVRGAGDVALWILARQATIHPRLKFRAVAQENAGRRYEAHFTRELEAAIKSARVRSGSFSSEAGRLAYLKARAGVG